MTDGQIAYLTYFIRYFGNPEPEKKEEIKINGNEKGCWY